MDKTNNTMGSRLTKLRESNRLSQKEFSERLNLSPATLSQYENDHVPISKRSLKVICKTFNARTEWLVDGEEPMYIQPTNLRNIEQISANISQLCHELQHLLNAELENLHAAEKNNKK